MPDPRPDPVALARLRQMRLVGVVLLATVVLWMAAQWLGGTLGWETRFVFLIDFAALAAFLWALVVTFQIWRGRQG
jgi:hypothetical protein